MARTIFVMRHSLRFDLMSLWSLIREALIMLFGPAEEGSAAMPPEVMLALDAPAWDGVPRRLFGIVFWTLAWRFIRFSDLGGEERNKCRIENQIDCFKADCWPPSTYL